MKLLRSNMVQPDVIMSFPSNVATPKNCNKPAPSIWIPFHIFLLFYINNLVILPRRACFVKEKSIKPRCICIKKTSFSPLLSKTRIVKKTSHLLINFKFEYIPKTETKLVKTHAWCRFFVRWKYVILKYVIIKYCPHMIDQILNILD